MLDVPAHPLLQDVRQRLLTLLIFRRILLVVVANRLRVLLGICAPCPSLVGEMWAVLQRVEVGVI
jgi:hypothetical protein